MLCVTCQQSPALFSKISILFWKNLIKTAVGTQVIYTIIPSLCLVTPWGDTNYILGML